MSTKDGKYLEQLVLLIEQSIDPNARMEHDVQMPILTSPSGATTQCDIVIWTGTPPRETITIIEVQDRNSKVKPNDFRGWQQKLEEVGAQHLICVSRQEFPTSIKEKAMQAGNRIHLINIMDSQPDKIPLNFLNSTFTYNHFKLKELRNMNFTVSRSEMEKHGIRNEALSRKDLNTNDKVFSYNQYELIALFKLCQNQIKIDEIGDTEFGTGKLAHKIDNVPPLYYLCEGKFIKVGIEFEFDYEKKAIELPVNVLSYEQSGDTLVWLLEAQYDSPKGMIEFKIPVKPFGENYIISNMSVNLPVDTELSMFVKKENK